MIAAAAETFGAVDVFVNNAALTGAAAAPQPFLEESDEHWRELIDVNLHGAFIGTQEAARKMVAQGNGGSIIMISSVASMPPRSTLHPTAPPKPPSTD
ncbi:MAG: SDR family oxidoreductase [Oscillochloris sp.]|nr:SDR family oxidoreductase [Oscillochloris sp.]